MLLEVKNLTKRFERGQVLAVDDVSFDLERGQTLGVMGESGSGKSTLAKLMLRLEEKDKGEVFLKGEPLSQMRGARLKGFHKSAQIIFQEPFLSLDPRLTVAESLREPFMIHRSVAANSLTKKVKELFSWVELPESYLSKRPHQLSGGECQRVAIARAIGLEPELLVCDEPVSSLDALVQVQILNLLLRLQQEKQMAFVFISHDLRVIRHMSDHVLVMKNGKACEKAPAPDFFTSPRHPYSQELVQRFFRHTSV